mmetsp:Transcript_38587/g.123674  ORF Transcript_38587/g.123674 Transcript_38587/m.123674 type:complete len:517 (+) Transcript_38587:485-2035(+)
MSAATRGDGTQGDDVTANAAFVGGVVRRLAPPPGVEVEVRGEVMMSKATFDGLRRDDDTSFTSARNAAAGSLRQRDAEATAGRNLSFYAHELVFNEKEDEEEAVAEEEAVSEEEAAEDDSYWGSSRRKLEEWGFECAGPARLCRSAADLLAYYESERDGREGRDLEIDGVVYKLDSHRARRAAGATAKAPRWAVAHKFDADAAVAATALLAVTVSVGKRGGLTPVASLEPVSVGDVTVSSATLHNAAAVRETLRGVDVGDAVFVKRAGDVIPQIVGAAATLRPVGHFDTWRLPERCPSCGTITVRPPNAAAKDFAEEKDFLDDDRYCPAAFDCPAQARERLWHFFARAALDLGAGVGKKKLEQLVEASIVRDPADLLALGHQTRDEALAALCGLDGWGKTSATKFLDAVERRRSTPVPYDRFLFALGAPRIGKTVAAKLAKDSFVFDDLWRILRSQDTDLQQTLADIPGVGVAALDSLRDFARDPVEDDVARRAEALLQLHFDQRLLAKPSPLPDR